MSSTLRSLDGMVAIVTGGSTGIGAATVMALASEECAILIDYVGDKDSADRTKAEAENLGGRASMVEADVSTEAGWSGPLKKTEWIRAAYRRRFSTSTPWSGETVTYGNFDLSRATRSELHSRSTIGAKSSEGQGLARLSTHRLLLMPCSGKVIQSRTSAASAARCSMLRST